MRTSKLVTNIHSHKASAGHANDRVEELLIIKSPSLCGGLLSILRNSLRCSLIAPLSAVSNAQVVFHGRAESMGNFLVSVFSGVALRYASIVQADRFFAFAIARHIGPLIHAVHSVGEYRIAYTLNSQTLTHDTDALMYAC